MLFLKFAVRQLRRNPAFAATVAITLALSVGANTAIFSIVDALLLKDLPYTQPQRIGALFARSTGGESFDMRRNVDGEQWELLRDHVPSLLPAISNLRPNGVYLQSGSHVQYLQAARISEHYLDVLGVRPVVGRYFSKDEDRPHGPKAAIISYTVWRNTFGTDPNIVGRSVLLKGEPYTIVGVLPERAVTPMNADIFTALQPGREGEGAATNFEPIVRLRDGAHWAQAGAEVDRAFRQSIRVRRFQQTNPGAQLTYYLVPLQKGITSKLRPQALALMLAAGLILLIACANLAGLTLVRMIRRSREIATDWRSAHLTGRSCGSYGRKACCSRCSEPSRASSSARWHCAGCWRCSPLIFCRSQASHSISGSWRSLWESRSWPACCSECSPL
jgi:hypothetical protein